MLLLYISVTVDSSIMSTTHTLKWLWNGPSSAVYDGVPYLYHVTNADQVRFVCVLFTWTCVTSSLDSALQMLPSVLKVFTRLVKPLVFSQKLIFFFTSEIAIVHWGKADDRNCNYGHPKMADVESGKNLFCRLNCFYNVF